MVDNCWNLGRIEPTAIQLYCADGAARLSGLVWSQWGNQTATGNGTLNERDCHPSCAEGRDYSYSVLVVLSKPTNTPQGSYFTAASVTKREEGPSGPRHEVFELIFP